MAERATLKALGAFSTSTKATAGYSLGKVVADSLGSISEEMHKQQRIQDVYDKESSAILMSDLKRDYAKQMSEYNFVDAENPTAAELRDVNSQIRESQRERRAMLIEKDRNDYDTFHFSQESIADQVEAKEAKTDVKLSLPSMIHDANDVSGINSLVKADPYKTMTPKQAYTTFADFHANRLITEYLDGKLKGKSRDDIFAEHNGIKDFMSNIKDKSITKGLSNILNLIESDFQTKATSDSSKKLGILKSGLNESLLVQAQESKTELTYQEVSSQIKDFITNSSKDIDSLSSDDQKLFNDFVREKQIKLLKLKDDNDTKEAKENILAQVNSAANVADLKKAVADSQGTKSPITLADALIHNAAHRVATGEADLEKGLLDDTGASDVTTGTKGLIAELKKLGTPEAEESILKINKFINKVDLNYHTKKEYKQIRKDILSGSFTNTNKYRYTKKEDVQRIYREEIDKKMAAGDYVGAAAIDNRSDSPGKIPALNSLAERVMGGDMNTANMAISIYENTKDTYQYSKKVKTAFTGFKILKDVMGIDLSTEDGFASFKALLNDNMGKVDTGGINKKKFYEDNEGNFPDLRFSIANNLVPYVGVDRATEYADTYVSSLMIDQEGVSTDAPTTGNIPAKLFGAKDATDIEYVKTAFRGSPEGDVALAYNPFKDVWKVEVSGQEPIWVSNGMMGRVLKEEKRRQEIGSAIEKELKVLDGTLPSNTSDMAVSKVVESSLNKIIRDRGIKLTDKQKEQIKIDLLKHALSDMGYRKD